MRIVAGRLRGRALTPPSTDAIRPTTDRARESLFNIIAARIGPVFAGRRVLDLFAGTGALGLEALSRGADFACFVDSGAEARGLIRGHVEQFGLGGQTKILKRDATDLGPVERFAPFDLIFLDPPYAQGLGERALAAALEGGWIAPEALIVLEEKAGQDVDLPEGIIEIDARTYAQSTIHLLEKS